MSQVPQPSPYPQVGEVIDGKYQIERMLGEGGMGAVAKAIHLMLRAPVALKFMNPQYVNFPGAVDRFLNEGVAARSIRSEHVVQVDDVGKLPSGAPYLVMACLDGMDLSELLARQGQPMEVERAVHFLLQVLKGLQVAHAVGIVHRDMKPSNCFVVKHEGEMDFIKILDFGISKVKQPGSASLTQTNSALGTPLYMSPEQARSPKDVDARSDIYSVGVILYELLAGQTPFMSETGEFTEILFKLFTADPPSIADFRSDLPPGFAEVVHKALARDPADRYQSATEFAEALIPFASKERSHNVIKKLQAFSADEHRHDESTDAMPASAFVFSQLDARPQSIIPGGMSALRPAPVPAHVSVIPAGAEPGVAGAVTFQSPESVARLAQSPKAVSTAIMANPSGEHSDAASRPGARTNLTATTDREPGQDGPPAKKGIAIPAAIAALVLLVGGAGGFMAVKARGAGAIESDRPVPSVTPQTTAPPASVTAAAPSASVPATASATPSATVAGTATTTAKATPTAKPTGATTGAAVTTAVAAPQPTKPGLSNTTLQQ